MTVMRALILIVAILILFILVGWVTVSNEPGRSSINLETEEMREDAGKAMHEGAELLQEAEDEVTPTEPKPASNPAP
jgi:hypothetical protein